MGFIDLRSDTVTQPTAKMREAIYNAVVGDDVYIDDPTTNELERRAAEILGFEAALFVTSGTMGNQLAIMCQTARGDEIIVDAQSHIHVHEVGAAAVLSGANMRMIYFENSVPNAKLIEEAIRPDDVHEPKTALICMENALGNGRVVDAKTMAEVYAVGQKHNIPVHVDGARIFNAAVALGVDVKELTKSCDTISCCLSKGLCAPVGAIFAGPKAVVDKARKYRKMLGGGMRQNGFLAAAGLIAIEEMPKRLHIDHENAKYMANELAKLPKVKVDFDRVQINMVFFNVDIDRKDIDALPQKMLEKGIKINGAEANGEMRFAASNDIDKNDIDTAVQALAACIG